MHEDLGALQNQILGEIAELELAIQASPGERIHLIKTWLMKDDEADLRTLRVLVYTASRGIHAMTQPPPQPIVNVYGNAGNINFGEQLGEINANITVLASKDENSRAVAEALEKLSSGIADSPTLSDNSKKEAIETVQGISEHAAKKGGAVSAVLRAMVSYLPTVLAASADATELWHTYGSIIRGFFGL